MRQVKSARAGSTMVEVIVSCSIIAILLGVMLPALNTSREAARRSQCLNNFRQVTLALQNYQATHEVLPPGVVNPTGPIVNLPEDYHIGWIVHLLPFLEQSGLNIDTTTSVYDPVNLGVAGARLTTLSCPSDANSKFFKGIGVSSYAGCHHDVEAPIDADNHGVFFLNSRVRGEDVTDGTSNTIYVGEKVIKAPDLGWFSGTRASLRNTGLTPNAVSRSAGTLQGKEADLYVGGFASRHPGGANFGFGDGSVRFLRDTIDPSVYRLLGHRADGEVVDLEDY